MPCYGNSMGIFIFILTFVIAWAILMNYFVWFKTDLFVKFIKKGQSKENMEAESQKHIWGFIESPQYIWYARFVFLVILVGITYFIVDYFNLI